MQNFSLRANVNDCEWGLFTYNIGHAVCECVSVDESHVNIDANEEKLSQSYICDLYALRRLRLRQRLHVPQLYNCRVNIVCVCVHIFSEIIFTSVYATSLFMYNQHTHSTEHTQIRIMNMVAICVRDTACSFFLLFSFAFTARSVYLSLGLDRIDVCAQHAFGWLNVVVAYCLKM